MVAGGARVGFIRAIAMAITTVIVTDIIMDTEEALPQDIMPADDRPTTMFTVTGKTRE